jgi:hypothetical protein
MAWWRGRVACQRVRVCSIYFFSEPHLMQSPSDHLDSTRMLRNASTRSNSSRQRIARWREQMRQRAFQHAQQARQAHLRQHRDALLQTISDPQYIPTIAEEEYMAWEHAQRRALFGNVREQREEEEARLQSAMTHNVSSHDDETDMSLMEADWAAAAEEDYWHQMMEVYEQTTTAPETSYHWDTCSGQPFTCADPELGMLRLCSVCDYCEVIPSTQTHQAS